MTLFGISYVLDLVVEQALEQASVLSLNSMEYFSHNHHDVKMMTFDPSFVYDHHVDMVVASLVVLAPALF